MWELCSRALLTAQLQRQMYEDFNAPSQSRGSILMNTRTIRNDGRSCVTCQSVSGHAHIQHRNNNSSRVRHIRFDLSLWLLPDLHKMYIHTFSRSSALSVLARWCIAQRTTACTRDRLIFFHPKMTTTICATIVCVLYMNLLGMVYQSKGALPDSIICRMPPLVCSKYYVTQSRHMYICIYFVYMQRIYT